MPPPEESQLTPHVTLRTSTSLSLLPPKKRSLTLNIPALGQKCGGSPSWHQALPCSSPLSDQHVWGPSGNVLRPSPPTKNTPTDSPKGLPGAAHKLREQRMELQGNCQLKDAGKHKFNIFSFTLCESLNSAAASNTNLASPCVCSDLTQWLLISRKVFMEPLDVSSLMTAQNPYPGG